MHVFNTSLGSIFRGIAHYDSIANKRVDAFFCRPCAFLDAASSLTANGQLFSRIHAPAVSRLLPPLQGQKAFKKTRERGRMIDFPERGTRNVAEMRLRIGEKMLQEVVENLGEFMKLKI